MDFISEYWEQLILLGLGALIMVKMKFVLDSHSKDIADLESRSTYIDVVKLRAEMDQSNRQITALWEHVNSLKSRG
jgi:hypothetical protein